ncbi:MAG: beta strand repeat-containing protein, partial [Mesorhizobium sp.]
MPVDAGAPAAQAGQQAPAALATPPAPAGHEYVAGADNVVHLPANASIDNIRVDGSNLVLQQADGSVIVIKDGAINVPSFIVGDVEVPRVALLAALESSGVNVAFGADGSISAGSAAAQHESAGGNFQQPPGGIGNGFDLSALLPPTELRFGGLDRHELYPAVANREPGIDITPNANGLAVPTGASASVAEQGLSFGSAPNENSEYSTGIFKLSDPDGLSDLKSLTIDGQTVQIGQLAGSVFAGQHGTLTILSYNEQTGIAKYQYQLTERTDDRAGLETDRFEISVSDGSTTSAPAQLVVNIVDDVPTAHAGPDLSVVETAGATAGANLLANDVKGADGATLTGVDFNDGAGPHAIAAAGVTTLTTANGVYTFQADGAWTFDPNANLSNAAGVDAGFTYTITDGDGDTSTAAQVVTITDGAGPTATQTPVALVVDEADLATGTTHGGANGGDPDTVAINAGGLVFTAGSDAIADVHFAAGQPAIQISGLDDAVSAQISWSGQGSDTLIGTINNVAVVRLELTGTQTAAVGGQAVPTVTATLLAPVPHQDNPDADTLTIKGIRVEAVDSDGSTKQVTLTLNIADDVPHAANDANGATENSQAAVGGNVLVNDDLGADHGVVGTDGRVSGVVSGAGGAEVTNGAGLGGIAGAHGTLVLGADGTYTYTPTAGASVPAGTTDVFTYTVIDKDGDTAHAELTITFSGDAFAPTAVDGVAATSDVAGDNHVAGSNADGFVAQVDTGTLAFDFGGDGPAAVSPFAASYDGGLGAALSQTSAGGVTTITAASWNLTINEVTGAYTFTQTAAYQHDLGATSDQGKVTVTLTDSDGSTKQVTLTLNIADDQPSAAPDTNSVNENASINGNVLGNDDLGADHGVVGTDGRVSGVAIGTDVSHAVSGNLGGAGIQGTYGTLVLNANGTYTYTANAVNGDQVDHFVYTITDADGDTSTTTLDITVKNVNSVPVGGSASAIVDDEGLPHGIFGGAGDAATNSAFATGTLTGSGGDGALSYSFANLNGATGVTIGQEKVDFTWNNSNHQLVATISTSTAGRVGQVLFTVDLDPSSGAYQVNLVNPVLHANANNAEVGDITLYLQYSVSDSDADTSVGDTGLGTLAVKFNDDSPVNFTAQSMTIENGASAIGSGALNFYESIGADGGKVAFSGGTDGVTKLMDGATTVTSGGKEVFLYGYGTDTLTGMIDLDGNGSKETTVFTVKLSPNATSEPNDIYTVQFFRMLDDGATTFITSSNLSETSARNFKMVNDQTSADKDILISASSSSGQTTVNGSNSGMIAFG